MFASLLTPALATLLFGGASRIAEDPNPLQVVVEVQILTLPESHFQRMTTAYRIPTDGEVATLSTKRVRELMEAAENTRQHQFLHTPLLTGGTGETLTIDVTSRRSFMTSVEMYWDGNEIVANPKVESFQEGLQLWVRPTVSADRRTLEVDLRCNQTVIHPVVPATNITAAGITGSQSVRIQMPKLIKQEVQKRFTVPDQHTAVFYGWKETPVNGKDGPPMLNKVPYVNRVLKNMGYGPPENKHLLMFVTPRIVASEVEEKGE